MAGALLILSAIDASAGEFRRDRTLTGPRGGTAERSITRGEQGGATINRRVQGPAGRGFTSETNRNCGNGECTREGTLTTNSGKTFTGSGTATRNEDGALVRQGTVTGPNGGVFNRNCTGAACTGTRTTADGKEYNSSSTVTRNEDGTFTRETTITGPNGGTATYNKTR
jgi:hypothetical protein